MVIHSVKLKSKPKLIQVDVIRQYQAQQLYNNYKLTSLWIYRASISKSFENQVLARQVDS